VRFDHLFMSRNESELQKRVDLLVKALEKEQIEGKLHTSTMSHLNKQPSMSSNPMLRHHSEDVDMSEEQEDVEMLEEKPVEPKKAKSSKKRVKQEATPQVENAEDEYNYLNDESAIRMGGDGAITPPFSDDKNVANGNEHEDEEFPEDDVDPIVYMGLVNRPQ
jgi:hypothetical protein